MASSAEQLSSQVASLNELVEQFKVGNGTSVGRSSKAGPSTPKPRSGPSKPSAPMKASTKGTRAAPSKASMSTAEQLIPMDEDEVLASF